MQYAWAEMWKMVLCRISMITSSFLPLCSFEIVMFRTGEVENAMSILVAFSIRCAFAWEFFVVLFRTNGTDCLCVSVYVFVVEFATLISSCEILYCRFSRVSKRTITILLTSFAPPLTTFPPLLTMAASSASERSRRTENLAYLQLFGESRIT